MNDLLRETLAEGVECLAALDVELARLERDPHDASAVAGAFRQMHTIKGSCACVRLARIGRLAHAAEDALAALRVDGGPATPRAVAALRLAAGRIRAVMLELAATGQEPAGDDGDVAASLAAAVSGDASPSEAEPAAPSLFGRLVGDLAGIRDRLLAQAAWRAPGAELRRLDDVVEGLRRVAPRLHWRPLRPLLEGLVRVVADLAAEQGKRAELAVTACDVDVDPRVLARLRPALIHLLRNAVDHGIEAPLERLHAGKPIVGRIAIAVEACGDRLRLRVADDGRGIDMAALRRRLAEAGTLDAALDEDGLRAQIFEPGVTTLDAPTALSGRGVGLDAVRTALEEAGGSVAIEPVPAGTCFVLDLPLSGEAPAAARTVLVVHDDPFSRRVIAPLLAAAGCRVVAVADEDKARALIETGERFDAVLAPGLAWSPPAARAVP